MRLIALAALLEIEPGDDLGTLLAEWLHGVEPSLARFDVLVIAQKVVESREPLPRPRVRDGLGTARATCGRYGQGSPAPGGDPGRVRRSAAPSPASSSSVTGWATSWRRRGWIVPTSAAWSAMLLPESPDESAARLRATPRGSPVSPPVS
jgi:hypothetical protein